VSAISRKRIEAQRALVKDMERSAHVETHPGLKAYYQRCASNDRHCLMEMEARLEAQESLRAKPRPTNRVFPLPIRGMA
jgi:hypothetical protein